MYMGWRRGEVNRVEGFVDYMIDNECRRYF